MRLLVLIAALLLFLMPAVGHAQSVTPTPTAGIEDEDDPGVVDDPSEAAEDDDPVDDEDVVPSDATGDTDYCSSDGDYSYDGDYTYCYPSAANPQEEGGGGRKDKDDDGEKPSAIEGATVSGAGVSALPRTGGEPIVLALMGLALICIGSGGRLMLGRR